MKNFYSKLCLFLAMVLTVQYSWGQGATTAALIGTVEDQSGTALPGATVIAVHTPTNTQYVAGTDTDGRYNIQNMRVGGPYTVRTSYIGYQEQVVEGVALSLGQTASVDIVLTEDSRQLSEVEVIGERNDVFNQDRTGAATNVSREQLENLPTLSRSLQDFTRLTPQASGNSIAGSSNRYNNITIDGAVNNDVFGLASSGTPGGGAGTQPISLDAIEQIQVVVAPYDVKLGNFTGGGINAVTRSGSNDFSGSVYGFGRNENTIGKSVEGDRERADEFSNYQYGVRVGGPILRDKLFFFFNYDATRITEPVRFAPGSPESQIPLSVTQDLADFVQNTYGYDVGSLGAFDRQTNSDKLFGRLDFNINDKHQLTLRHNFVDAFQDEFTRSRSFIRLGNNAYQFTSSTNSTVLELNSRFSNAFSNNLILGYSRIRDSRAIAGDLFPQVTIADEIGTFEFGAQRSSTANELDQDIFEITNNFTYILGSHNFTFGTHNEFFKFRNLFINNANGRWDFNSLEDFYAGIASRVQATYSLTEDPRPSAEFNAMQLGFYVQDEFTASEKLKLTLGLRADIPVFPDTPDRNLKFEEDFANVAPGLRTDRTPGGNVLWAPRFGFNYTPTEDRSFQVRGGTGIFTGRVPFVWLSNQFTNTGTVFGTVFQNDPEEFITDVDQQRNAGASNTTVEVNVVSEDFKLPQVWRSNLAFDYTLPGEIVATVEGIYTKTLNDVVYRNLNLTAPVGTLPGVDKRNVYASSTSARRVNGDYTNVILLDNTDEGSRYSITGQLRKDFANGLQTSIAYTYGKSRDVNSGTSSTALSNWEFNQIVNDPNNPELGYSRYDVRHRIVGTTGYTFRYANNFATGISLFYQGQSGLPFTYLYSQDLNNDANRGNDLLYIPRNESEINLVDDEDLGSADAQWAALDAFIENDEYLSEHRGEYAERHGARMPWTHQFDLRLFQDFYINTGDDQKHTLQITFDIFNVGNLLNRDWGHQYFVNNSANEIIRFAGRNDEGEPTFTFNQNNRAYNLSQFDSRWQGQLGLRYIFN